MSFAFETKKTKPLDLGVCALTTHLLSIERGDWPKLIDMFNARDAKA